MKYPTTSMLILLLGLIIGIRIWMIAQAPSAFGIDPGDVHPDQGVVVLMAKHILEGGEFPIFQYDTAYLGSLEAFLLSTGYLLFGINLWVIHLIPVFCFIFFCLALFLLAGDLFGSQVGLWSLLWCVFATITVSENSIMPQLGNISALTFGTVLLCITIKVIKSSNLITKRWGYGFLGLLGGVGWWTSPMVTYYLIAIPLFILLKEKFWETLRGGLRAVLLFIIGALPFFCYYALDPQLKFLVMGEGYSLKNLKEGLPLFFLERIHYFLDLDKFGSLHWLALWIGAFIYLGATILFFWGLRQDLMYLMKPRQWSKISPGFILGLFFLVFLFTLSSSIHIERNATRYFLPLASFFPLAIGCGVVYFRKHGRLISIFLGLLIFFLQMGVSWNFVKAKAPSAEAATGMIIGLTKELAGKEIRHVYSWESPGSELINFYSKEQIISSRPMLERYRPYEDILESSDQVAFLDPGDKPILPTLRVIGGSCLQEKIPPYLLYYGFKPPLREYREIPKEEFRLEVTDQPQNAAKMIDRKLDTEWSSGRSKSPDMWLRIDLGKIHSLGRIRLFNYGFHQAQYPYQIELEVSLDGLSWKKIIPETPINPFYWDGPRIYCWELNYRWECCFGPLPARYLMIRNKEKTERFPWSIGELYLYEDQGKLPIASFDYKGLVERIQGLGLQRIYAGRWLSAKIRAATRGEIQTVRIFTEASFDRRWPQSRVIEFGPRTGFVLERQDQAGFEELLNQSGLKLARESFGRWGLYYFKEWGRQKYLKNHQDFWWTGFGILKAGPSARYEFHRRGLDQWN